VARATTLWRIGALRWLTLLAFNLTYVAVPTLLFERTRSATLVGLAMFVEGVLRAGLAAWAGQMFQRIGAHRGMAIAVLLRLVALAALAASLAWFSVLLVAAASTLFYCGHFFSTLEQELRCARLGDAAVAGQTAYRIAEAVAPPLSFALALASGRFGNEYDVLLAVCAVVVALHGLLFFAWFGDERRAGAAVAARAPLAEAARFLAGDRPLAFGLAASVIGFGLFGWAVLATPFVLTGRVLLDITLDSVAGVALFKTLAAVVGVAGALAWGRLLTHAGGHRVIVWAVLAAPLLFATALTTSSDVLAVALLAGVCAVLLGLFSWQRRLRQTRTPVALFPALTSLCLAIECLGVSLAGIALMLRAPWVLGIGCAVVLAALLLPSTMNSDKR